MKTQRTYSPTARTVRRLSVPAMDRGGLVLVSSRRKRKRRASVRYIAARRDASPHRETAALEQGFSVLVGGGFAGNGRGLAAPEPLRGGIAFQPLRGGGFLLERQHGVIAHDEATEILAGEGDCFGEGGICFQGSGAEPPSVPRSSAQRISAASISRCVAHNGLKAGSCE